MKSTIAKIDLNKTGVFRPASSKDVFEGNIVFLVADENKLIRMVVEEVLNPSDDFKAFMFDGCRYGLDGLYVVINNNELHAQVIELKRKIKSIKEVLKA